MALDSIVPIVGLSVIAIVLFAAAVWFGWRVLAPRLGRALDRMDADATDEEPGDRTD